VPEEIHRIGDSRRALADANTEGDGANVGWIRGEVGRIKAERTIGTCPRALAIRPAGAKRPAGGRLRWS
jgi:hypothetical protein